MRIRTLLRNLFTAERLDRDLDEELHAYIEMLAAQKIAAGVAKERAYREARLELGGVEQIKEEVRAARVGALIGQILQDARYAGRLLRRNPLFAAVASLTLALGVGANIAIFTIVNSVLLRPLPFPAADTLIRVAGMTYTGEFVELEQRATSFDAAAYRERQVTLTEAGEATLVPTAVVSPGLMGLLGVRAALGRPLVRGDERVTDGAVAMISSELWRARFAADPSIVGRRLVVDGVSRTIVGVMPPDVAFPSQDTHIWTTEEIDITNRIALWSTSRRIIGRLRPGATVEQADSEVRALAPSMRALFPWSMPPDYGTTAGAVPLRESIVANVRPLLMLLLAAVTVVLLIAAVNVGNLLIARTLARQRELAIRASLGAGRGRIVRQVLTEGSLLVALGFALAAPVAYLALQFMTIALAADMPRPLHARVDGRLLAFAAATLAICTLLVGLAPALRASGVELVSRFAEGERHGQGRRTRWMSNLLIAAQVALAVVLVTTSVLLARSLEKLNAIAPGFTTERTLTARVSPPAHRFRDATACRELYRAILERVGALPRVSSVAVTDRLPFGGDTFGSVFVIEGRPDPARTGDWPMADVSSVVSPGFFATLGIPVLEGRGLTPEDGETAQRVVVISESLTRKYWPGESAIGRRFGFPGESQPPRTIVGVVADVKWQRVTDAGLTAIYVPLAQSVPGSMRIVVRTTGEEADTIENLRAIVRTLDPHTPVDRFATMESLIARSTDQPRFATSVIGAFAVAGLLLGAIGIYGTVADHVTQRRREIGIRLALGAQRRDVLKAVLGGTLLVVAAGAVAGLAGAAAVTRLFEAMLYEVTPTDPTAFLVSFAILTVTAVIAGYVPARRASAIDPASTLKLG